MSGKETQLDPDILDEAAEWLMRLNAGLDENERAALESWRNRSVMHAQAWKRAERLMGQLEQLPPRISMPVLNRGHNPKRRAALKHMLIAVGSIPLVWGSVELTQQAGWGADYQTAKGERREIRLADGSVITLNTDTAVDTVFDEQQRLLVLRHGELLIETAKDGQVPARPFRVATEEGQLQALGTRFNVRRDHAGQTQVAVFEGAVRVSPTAGPAVILNAGEQGIMTPAALGERKTADPTAIAWQHGMLVADRMRLEHFGKELARYRNGLVRVDPVIAGLEVSGAYPVADTAQVFQMLASTYPVDVKVGMLGYVITLAPRP